MTAALALAVGWWPGGAVAAPDVLQLHVVEAPGTAGSSAVASARVERAMGQARDAYAASQFTRCARLLQAAEVRLQHHLRRRGDLARVKRLNLWLGLCQTLTGDAEAAALSWSRAARLPGPGPDPKVFPPQVMRQYRELVARRAKQAAETCTLTLSGSTRSVLINGRPVAAGELVQPGEHYVIWPEGRSARQRIGAACRLVLPTGAGGREAGVTEEEAADAGFLGQVGRAAGVTNIWLLESKPARLQVSVFDVARGAFVERSRQLLPPAGGAAQPASAPTETGPSPWYRRWWVWTLIGAGVAAAVIIPVMATQEQRYDIVF